MTELLHKLIIDDLRTVVARRSRPGITLWNRLEGRPRADKFDRALRAEVRDPLWMLTRQWQMGEFRGDDAGSPIAVKVRIETTRLRKYQAAGGPVEPFDDNMPLEAHVERMPIPFVQGAHEMSLDIRLLMGRQWMKLIAADACCGARRVLLSISGTCSRSDRCRPMRRPARIRKPGRRSRQSPGAGMDGAQLYLYLKDAGAPRVGRHRRARRARGGGRRARRALRRLVRASCSTSRDASSALAAGPARVPIRLCRTGGCQTKRCCVAEEYFHGHLDWYNFDVDPTRDSLGPAPAAEPPSSTTLTMLPTQVDLQRHAEHALVDVRGRPARTSAT